MILVGMKCDLEKDRKVTKEEAEEAKQSHNFLYYVECSAQELTNISKVFI